ncbi:E3 ubiquitin-protein ligase DMA2 [Yarrowia sp. B02]|nr:E3 ubiquitin-protein ligase DMA2 [Yarrowia sp. B02]
MPSSPKKKRFFNIGSVFNPKGNTNTHQGPSTSAPAPSTPAASTTSPSGARTPTANSDPLELTASPSPSNDLLSGPKTTTNTSDTPVLADFGKNKAGFRSTYINTSSTPSTNPFANLAPNTNGTTSPALGASNPVPVSNNPGLRLDISPGAVEQVKSPSTPYNNQGLAVEEFFHDCGPGPSNDIVTSVTSTNEHPQESPDSSDNIPNSTPPDSPTGSSSPGMSIAGPKRAGTGMRSTSAATLHSHDNAGQREVDQLEGMDEEEDVQMADSLDTDEHAGDSMDDSPELSNAAGHSTPSAAATTAAAGPASANSSGAPSSSQSSAPGSAGSASEAPSATCATASSAAPPSAPSEPQVPSIRLTPVIDHSTSTPAQYFGPIERRLATGSIRIGRQTESKDEPQLPQYERPIVFKSKVVSRSHAEFFVKDDQWFVQDMRSSSGTFLNRRRLSEAGKPSKPHVLKNGDMLQFGMDFRGGTEEIFKCIKVRVETNQSWKRKVQQYNIEAVERLRGVANGDPTDAECAICLVAVGPCQPLFIAPCSHAWHYKCIRPLMVKTYPHFQCPNCRNICDLEADADESMVMEG